MNKICIQGLDKTYASKGADHGACASQSHHPAERVRDAGRPFWLRKSTLLKLIGALIRPSRGVLLFDRAVLAHPPRDVGIVFQEAVLLP
jgi:hypothetical protein